MPLPPDSSAAFEHLRQRAEARLRHAVPATGHFTPAQVQELLLELETHQVELQLQHEELLAAHVAAETARAEYADLYEHSPVACVTLTAGGVIERVNYRARQLLGTDAGQLVGRRFLLFVAEPSRPACADWLAALQADATPHTTEATLLTAAGTPWAAQLEGMAGPAQGAGRSCRVVLLDVSERHRAAAALHRSQERARLALAAAGAGVVEWDCAT
ncbi:MAG: PAS domain S-box protein, partial [Hymenobacter sp.]